MSGIKIRFLGELEGSPRAQAIAAALDAHPVEGAQDADLVVTTPAELEEMLEDAAATAAFHSTRHQEAVPAEMVDRLVAGENAVKVWREHRGLSQRAVNFGHALRNTLVPVITVIGLQLGAIIAFAIITETVFQWPGMGLMFIQAVQNADIPIMAGYLMLVAFLFVFINFIVDLIYVRVDPRIRIYGRGV